MTNPTLTRDETVEALRDWARGSLPLTAAVEFAAASRLPLGRMVAHDGDRTYLDVFVDDDRAPDYLTTEQWADKVGYMSSGERGTWELVRSLAAGELEEWFWRLDGTLQAAFVAALAGGGCP